MSEGTDHLGPRAKRLLGEARLLIASLRVAQACGDGEAAALNATKAVERLLVLRDELGHPD